MKKVLACAIGILLVLLGVGFAFSIVMYCQATKLDINEVSNDKKIEVAEDCFNMPEIASYIERETVGGMRDTFHIYETNWFESEEALIDILPFEKDSEREELIEYLSTLQPCDAWNAFNEIDPDCNFYQISNDYLPIDEKETSFSYTVEYYIIVSSSGQARLGLLRETM